MSKIAGMIRTSDSVRRLMMMKRRGGTGVIWNEWNISLNTVSQCLGLWWSKSLIKREDGAAILTSGVLSNCRLEPSGIQWFNNEKLAFTS